MHEKITTKRDICPKSELVGQVWENGELSLAWDTSGARLHKQQIKDAADWDNIRDKSYVAVSYAQDLDKIALSEQISLEDAQIHGYISEKEKAVRLGLVNAAIFSKTYIAPRKRKGLSGITSLGKKLVRNACHRLAAEVGIYALGFVTFTLPPLGDFIESKVHWQHFYKLEVKLRTTILEYLKWEGLENPEIILVTEIQEERYDNHGFPYPHFHTVYQCKKHSKRVHHINNPWLISAKDCRFLWQKVVLDWLWELYEEFGFPEPKAILEQMSFRASIDMVPCSKSPEDYLSKYLSKGQGIAELMQDRGHERIVPYQWWFITMSLRKRVRDHVLDIPSTAAIFIYYNAELLCEQGFLKWFRYIDIGDIDMPKTIGIAAKFTLEGIKWYLDLFPPKDWEIEE